MELSGQQQRQLQQILTRAFPKRSDLAQMVRFGLDANLDELTSSEDLGTTVFQLVEWARAHDRLPALLAAAVDANPDNSELRAFADSQAAAPAGTAPAGQDAAACLERGAAFYTQQQYDAALTEFGRAIALDLGNPLAAYNRGVTYNALGRYDAALADLTRSLDLDPTNARAYGNRANTYAALDRQDEALADYTRAIALDPAYALAYYNRSLVYQALGRSPEADADQARAIELDPTLANR